jgi:hypothetical protein
LPAYATGDWTRALLLGALYWYENPTMSVEELMAANMRKILVDWEKKITLPEVKEAFSKYRDFNLQVAGQLTDTYLK